MMKKFNIKNILMPFLIMLILLQFIFCIQIMTGTAADYGVTGISTPTILADINLDGSLLTLTLYGTGNSFSPTIGSSDFTLNNAPSGLSISNVQRTSNLIISLTFAYNGTSISSDINNFSVTILESSNTKNIAQTTNDLTIKYIKYVEGQGNYYITGESYPTNIEFAGYNSKNNTTYINFTLQTTKVLTAVQHATFYYLIDIYNSSGILIGSNGSLDNPNVEISTSNSNTVYLYNKPVNLSATLTPNYRIVITTKSVIIN